MKTAYVIFLGLFTLFAECAKSQTSPAPGLIVNNEIVFASDTQAPVWIETLWLRGNRNRFATEKIFADVLKRKPRAFFLLGDVVALGSSSKQWRTMGKYLNQLRSNGIKVNAALGNHDLMLESEMAQKKFQEHFPDHVKTGSVEIIDSVAVILLNSNYKTLSEKEDTTQVSWYRNTLNKLDNDPSIQFIISGCHHSPFTNSRAVGSSAKVQKTFVPSFLKSQKSRLFLSGHTHAFEYFKVKGKDFIVIGGGGGMYQPLKRGKKTILDLAADYKPMFHYLSIRREASRLQVASIRLKADFSGFEEGLKLYINNAADSSSSVPDSTALYSGFAEPKENAGIDNLK